MEKVSWDTKPVIEPEPYWISKEEPLATAVEERALSYLACNMQAIDLHCLEGIHKLDEPVSRMTWKSCAGVPSEIF